MFWGATDLKSFFSKLGTVLNSLALENEKLSGEGFKNKSILRAEISYVPMQTNFRGDIRGLCSQSTQRTNKFGFFCVTTLYTISSLF